MYRTDASSSTAVIDFLALLFFSSLTSVVLTVGVVVCLICKLPLVEYLVGLYSRLNGGYSLVNSSSYPLVLVSFPNLTISPS